MATEGRVCTRCREYKELSAFHKKLAKQAAACKECRKIESAKYRANNSDKIKVLARAWHEKNRDYSNQKCKEWREANAERAAKMQKEWHLRNPGRIVEKNREWRANNPEKLREQGKRARLRNGSKIKARIKRWAEKNAERRRATSREYFKKRPEKAAMINAKRRSSLQAATPPWRNEFVIGEIYHLAKLRTEVTGIKWEVDHIVPLRSAFVCGLHVECNLAVIPMSTNRKKLNRYWPDMAEAA